MEASVSASRARRWVQALERGHEQDAGSASRGSGSLGGMDERPQRRVTCPAIEVRARGCPSSEEWQHPPQPWDQSERPVKGRRVRGG